ncbi:hypothetical protein DL93DRAFT_2152555 [Clavulina sp. PMI_390]|nr:hypothetical protein DL93DRAFT_2152555 [Clavulina sp. PMI_390]
MSPYASCDVALMPLELWCEIAQCLDVHSLVRWGAVSKSFCELINETRSIWATKVAQMIREECLAPYSIPIAESSVASLKAFATRSSRFCYAIRVHYIPGLSLKAPPCIIPSRSVNYLLHKDGLGSRSPPQFHTVLPGGRWALEANSIRDESYISCWDLEQSDCPPVVHRLPKNLAIFDIEGDESAIITQSSPTDRSVVIMIRTCSAEGEYDVDIVRLSWTSSDGHFEATPHFEAVNRLDPGAMFIEGAYLEGSLACMGSGPNWILWDWRENHALRVRLESASGENAMHIMLRPDAFFTVSRGGRVSMFLMPILKPITRENIKFSLLAPAVTSESYGTLRKSSTLDSWIPISHRPRALVCLKTTMLPTSPEADLETRAFRCPAILLDYGAKDAPKIKLSDGIPLSREKALKAMLPEAVYYGRGNLDWKGAFALADGILLEQWFQIKAGPVPPSRPVPHLYFDFHHKVRSALERRPPWPGTLVLGTTQFFDPSNEEECRQGLFICYASARVFLARPRLRSIEAFEFA